MTKVILVRHGQTEWNRDERFRGHADIPLDETGRNQAEATARRITLQWKPAAVYAGPLSRTIHTAEPIAREISSTVKIAENLIDADCGHWQGLTTNEVRERWPVEFQSYLHAPRDFKFPGGESLETARRRAMKCISALIERHLNQIIVLVSHTVLNRLILLSVLGLDSHSFWKIRQDTCAINVFDTEENHFTLITLNETSHLLSMNPNELIGQSETI